MSFVTCRLPPCRSAATSPASAPTSRRTASAPTGPSSPATPLRRDNAFFTWDLRLSRRFTLPGGAVVEPIVEVFNLTNADNFVDTAVGSLLFNFDSTLRSGLGDTRRGQLGLSVRF